VSIRGLHAGGLDDLRLSGSCLTIGSFDGVHLGHRHLLGELVADARRRGVPAVVLTFYPHPSVVVRGRSPSFYLSSPDEKAALMAEAGVDVVITQPFDAALSQVPADVFLEWVIGRLAPQVLWVGPDFALGRDRQGDVAFLGQHAGVHGYQLRVVAPYRLQGGVVSSSRIRQALRLGDVQLAATLLGRWFALPGRVERGAGRGRQLGIPTANLQVWPERAYPAQGVYACFAQVDGQQYPAVTNIGLRPTFEPGETRPVVESHLLDFDSDLYDQHMTLQLVERLRDERKFEGVEALVEQIRRDIERARAILAEEGQPRRP
jgi:riboflavin kinase/FMN adenylyltransferase